MAGLWRSEFNTVARNGITNYAKLYGMDTGAIGILMLLDRNKNAQFHITVGKGNDPKIREQVKFLHILHKPTTKVDVTGKAYFIPKFIGKALERLAQNFGIDQAVFNVRVQMQDKEIYLFVMDGTRMVKLLGDEEAFDDDQVTMDLMEEAK